MSRTSSQEPDGQITDSVYDFLYYDTRRVASFLAQFDKSGYLTGIAQSAERIRTREDTDKTAGSVLLVGGEVTESASDGWAKGSQRTYDPSWANALALLDHLDQSNLIVRDIGAAAVGQIVLFAGDLQVTDLLTMSKTWELPTVRKLMDGAAGTPPPRLSSSQRKNPHTVALHEAATKQHEVSQNGLAMFRDMVKILRKRCAGHTLAAKFQGSSSLIRLCLWSATMAWSVAASQA